MGGFEVEGIGGGEHLFGEEGDAGVDVGGEDADAEALEDEGGEGGVGAVGFGGLAGCVLGTDLEVFGDGHFGGIDAVFGVIAGRTGLALRGAGAGGFLGIGAIGGEAFFGEGEFGHGYLRRRAESRWRARLR